MSRTNTIGYGSPKRPRSGSSRRADEPLSTRDIPSAESFEARWFAPTNPPLASQLEARRGWSPPPPSKGLVFTGVSLLLVGIATAGTFFFFAPAESRHVPSPASTTSVTNAELPRPNATEPSSAAATDTAKPAEAANAASITTVTPKDLPTAKPQAAPPTKPVVHAAAPKPRPLPPVRKPSPVRSHSASAAPSEETERGTSTNTLPDLDRAATAAGVTPAPSQTAEMSAPSTIGTSTIGTSTSDVPATAPSTVPTDVPQNFEQQR